VLLDTATSSAAPLATLTAVLRHQQQRAASAPVRAKAQELAAAADRNRAEGRFPLLELGAAVGSIDIEFRSALVALTPNAVPEALAEAGTIVLAYATPDRRHLISDWIEDPELVDPLVAFWFRVAAGTLLETAAARVSGPSGDEWKGAACPLCGGSAQVSVIAEESGEFMGGSPRNLVCCRCSSWWSYPRITCALCGEEDPRRVNAFVVTGHRLARVDACATCHGYTKTFDLREPGGVDVVPLVDDVATMTLDLWAQQHGFDRSSLSFAGI
jgi:FdhE protein